MKRETIMVGIVGLLAGIVIAGFTATQAVNNNYTGMMRMMGMHIDNEDELGDPTDHSKMSMSQMTNELKKLSGDDYDNAFIEMMIAHHNGAIDMAELSGTRAKHDEIKKLSEEISTAQLKEISDMYKWQKDWGYSTGQLMHNYH